MDPRPAVERVEIFAVAEDAGSGAKGASRGPAAVHASGLLPRLSALGLRWRWHGPRAATLSCGEGSALEAVARSCRALAAGVRAAVAEGQRFVVIGGDHSYAVGTWKGAMAARRPVGLLWVDAHMDSHTPETSPSHALHGMSLASLLGFGAPALVNLDGNQARLSPQNVRLVGVRSFEDEEAELLEGLGVVVHGMEEIRRDGLEAVMRRALGAVRKSAGGFGVSVDLDAIDPAHAPGVTTPVARGLDRDALIQALAGLARDERFLGVEIAELNPERDQRGLTVGVVDELVRSVLAPAGTGCPPRGPGDDVAPPRSR